MEFTRNGQIIDNIAKSFQNLVNTNNGFFKSEKQAKFLLSKTDKFKTYLSISQMYNYTFERTFFCDDKGVFKIEQRNHKTNKISINWERYGSENPNDTQHAKKYIKHLEKLINKRKSELDHFLQPWIKEKFEKSNSLYLYEESLNRKKTDLENVVTKLENIRSNKLIVIDNKGRTKNKNI